MGFSTLDSGCLVELRAGRAGDPTVLMLPHAGSSAAALAPLARALPAGVRALAAQYPGRGARAGEPTAATLGELAGAILVAVRAQVRGPLVVFGHSLGAMLGWRLVLGLESAGRPVASFVPSACQPPHVPNPDAARMAAMGRDELVAFLRRVGGLPAEILAEPDLLDLVLPAVRADLALSRGYPSAVLDARAAGPIAAVGWARDPIAPPALLSRWCEATTGPATSSVLPGGHFSFLDAPAEVGVIVTARF
jgi:surfactin synthase thioesterase subunit